LSKNLLSVPVITDNDGTAMFSKKVIEIWKDGNKVLEGARTTNGLFSTPYKNSLKTGKTMCVLSGDFNKSRI
jgi:hypothetical protein